MKIKQLKKKWILLLILISISILSFKVYDDIDDFELVKNLEIYHAVFKELRTLYVDDIDAGKLVTTSIQKMLDELDPYTNYYPEHQIEDYRLQSGEGNGGIGAGFRIIDGKVTVTEIYENFPAHKAGILPGFIVEKVNGKACGSINFSEFQDILTGAPGTIISLTLLNPTTNKIIDVDLRRNSLENPNIPYFGLSKQNVGYIKLASFGKDASVDFKNALLKLKTDSNLDGLIIDLRNNPGGLLIESVKIVNMFVATGSTIVSTKGKSESINRTFQAMDSPIDLNIPLVVLVNRKSASASEIVAGALQDLDRAIIIGERTYGKGLVQNTKDLPYNSKMKLTIAKYYTPTGRCIQTLDYSHRNSDGSVGTIPDSLIRMFKTKNGRPVFEGGGVDPDLKFSSDTMTEFVNALLKNEMIFKFAARFRLTNAEIIEPELFKLDNANIEKFKEFLIAQNFKFESESELLIQQLRITAKNDNFYDLIKENIDGIESKLQNNNNLAIDVNRNYINRLITQEILGMYYFERGKYIHSVKNELIISNSVDILMNKQLYNKHLKK